MKINVNIADLVSDIKKENDAIEKVASVENEEISVSAALSGVKKELSDLEKLASDLSDEVGFDVKIEKSLEKVASDMEGAKSVEAIIKIAQESGNEDLANIAIIADAFADVVIARVSDQLKA